LRGRVDVASARILICRGSGALASQATRAVVESACVHDAACICSFADLLSQLLLRLLEFSLINSLNHLAINNLLELIYQL